MNTGDHEAYVANGIVEHLTADGLLGLVKILKSKFFKETLFIKRCMLT